MRIRGYNNTTPYLTRLITAASPEPPLFFPLFTTLITQFTILFFNHRTNYKTAPPASWRNRCNRVWMGAEKRGSHPMEGSWVCWVSFTIKCWKCHKSHGYFRTQCDFTAVDWEVGEKSIIAKHKCKQPKQINKYEPRSEAEGRRNLSDCPRLPANVQQITPSAAANEICQ